MVLGGIAGALTEESTRLFGLPLLPGYDLIGDLFINALKMVVVPLITTAIISGMVNVGDGDDLGRLGLKTVLFYLSTSLIAVLGAAGLAVGLALQGTLQNIAAGIMLLILRPIRAGEYIALSSGADGTVEEVGLFLTRLVQGDGIHLTLPNSTVWNATITNYSRNKTRRLDIPVPVRYGDDLDAVVAKLQQIVDARPDALKDPAPQVKVFDYKENGVTVNVRVWAESGKYWELRWSLYQEIRRALEEAGFQAPIPLREIQNPKTGAAAS